MEEGNLIQRIESYLGTQSVGLSVIEEKIDLNTHLEFTEFKKHNTPKISKDEIIKEGENLFSPEVEIEDKKRIIAQLTMLNMVEAFRIIEKYHESPDTELSKWATVAYQESKASLESNLLGENRIFISTGLGGKGEKLRFQAIIGNKQGEGFSDYQKKILTTEFNYYLSSSDIEVEEMNYIEQFLSITVLIPLEAPINKIFRKAIKECNIMGDFLDENILFTNNKKLETIENINAEIELGKKKMDQQ